MTAVDSSLKIFEIFILLSLMAMLESKICQQNRQEEILVRRKGHMETVQVNRTIKVCCQGYTIDKMNPSQCVPLCSEGFVYENGSCRPECDACANGVCMAPNICQCDEEYEKVKSGCVPKCEMECKNGHCDKPGVCGCNEGYVPSQNGRSCEPICDNCENGFCLKPGECQCKQGYKFTEHGKYKCRPVCKKPCEHGNCSAPDVCTCHRGYRYSSLDPYVCVQHKNARYDMTEREEITVRPTPESLPEVEGLFRYFGKKIRFVGHLVEEEVMPNEL